MKAGKSELKMFAVVRNAEGKPKFDDIFNIPPQIWDSLEPWERREIDVEINKRKQRGDTDGRYP